MLTFSPVFAVSWLTRSLIVISLILDEWLLEQNSVGAELIDPTLNHLLDDIGRFTWRSSDRPSPDQVRSHVSFAIDLCRNVLDFDVLRLRSAQMCIATSLDESLEIIGTGDKVGLTVDLKHHADLSTHMDIGSRLLPPDCNATLSSSSRSPDPDLRRVSIAFCSLPSDSVSAFLHSIIPAPVFSRRLRTISAVIAMVVISSCFYRRYRPLNFLAYIALLPLLPLLRLLVTALTLSH
jgi:hypothetical protein